MMAQVRQRLNRVRRVNSLTCWRSTTSRRRSTTPRRPTMTRAVPGNSALASGLESTHGCLEHLGGGVIGHGRVEADRRAKGYFHWMLARPPLSLRPRFVRAPYPHGHYRHAQLERHQSNSRPEGANAAIGRACSLREHEERPPLVEQLATPFQRGTHRPAAGEGEGIEQQ